MSLEDLLQFAWKHRILPLKELNTTHKQPLEVLDPGLHNKEAGPDFTQAKIKIGSTLWAGNVEMHVRASDWYRHRHDRNPVYDSVILHVVLQADTAVCNSRGEPVPQLEITLPPYLTGRYRELKSEELLPRCHRIIPKLPPLILHGWLNALLAERLEMRTGQIGERLMRLNRNWEDCLFVTLARSFGFGINGDAFEQWALSLPLRAADRHRDNLMQVEALFFGQAGLLDPEAIPPGYRTKALDEGYFTRLRKEYLYLANKFGLKPTDFRQWKFLRLRPASFPHIRIAQLAHLYYGQQISISALTEVGDLKDVLNLFHSGTSDYWKTHSNFGATGTGYAKRISLKSTQLIVLNAIVPLLFAYGRHRYNENYQQLALKLSEEIGPENNLIIRQWKQCGIQAEHAADTQALIQLRKEYCDRKDCLRCRLGYEYLKHNSNDDSLCRQP